jgi:hypothetical protein
MGMTRMEMGMEMGMGDGEKGREQERDELLTIFFTIYVVNLISTGTL